MPISGVQNTAVGLHVQKKAEQAIQPNGEQAVEREKIGRERNPEIVFVGNDVTAFATNAKTADPAAHEINPERVRKFVTENVKQHGRGRPKNAINHKTAPNEKNQNCSPAQSRCETVARAKTVKKVWLRIGADRQKK